MRTIGCGFRVPEQKIGQRVTNFVFRKFRYLGDLFLGVRTAPDASLTRSAGESLRSIRAIRRELSDVLVSRVSRELSELIVLPCLPLAFLYSRKAWRLSEIF